MYRWTRSNWKNAFLSDLYAYEHWDFYAYVCTLLIYMLQIYESWVISMLEIYETYGYVMELPVGVYATVGLYATVERFLCEVYMMGLGLVGHRDATGETKEERWRLRKEQEALHASSLYVPRQ
jgi:hypothetical protein